MDSGSSSIELSIDGPDGKQQVVVPVMAVATALRDMPAGTGLGLAAMGLLLVVMLVTIIGASNADGIVAPGRRYRYTPASTVGRHGNWSGSDHADFGGLAVLVEQHGRILSERTTLPASPHSDIGA